MNITIASNVFLPPFVSFRLITPKNNVTCYCCIFFDSNVIDLEKVKGRDREVHIVMPHTPRWLYIYPPRRRRAVFFVGSKFPTEFVSPSLRLIHRIELPSIIYSLFDHQLVERMHEVQKPGREAKYAPRVWSCLFKFLCCLWVKVRPYRLFSRGGVPYRADADHESD